MKILDVQPFHEGIQRNIVMLQRIGDEMEAIRKATDGLVVMDDSLKGEGGNAIRSFYEECHLPFLQFHSTFQKNFISILERMDDALDALESSPSGFIRESFLEGEIEQGLTEIAQITESLTDEANSIMDQVADIVGLPHLDDSDVQEGVQRAKIKRDDTVTALHEFDANQTTALTPIETDLATMDSWISNIESLFTDGTTDIDFPMERWSALTEKNSLKTDLAHRTAKMAGIGGTTDVNGHPGMMLGADATGGNPVMHPEGFGYGPGEFYGTGAYSLPGTSSQASPLHDAGISGAAMYGSSAVITSGGKSVSGQVTSTSATQVEKPKKKKKKNKVLGFLKDAADFLILDDVKTVFDPKASLWDKGVAIFSVTPTGKALKAGRLGFKLVKNTPFGKAVVKKVDQAVDLAKAKQRSTIKSVENGSVKLKTNKRKGNYGEMKMDVHFENQGYTRVSKDRVTGLDDKIAKGIDGVYEKTGPPRKFVIGEAKYNTSRLGTTKDGNKQMSDNWIEAEGRLKKAVGSNKANEIIMEKLLRPQNVSKELIHIDKSGKITQSNINKLGKVVK